MKKDMMVFIIAIVSGLVAFVMVFNFLQHAQRPSLRFVIAVADIPQGVEIQKTDVALSATATSGKKSELFLQTEDVIGQITVQGIKKKELITRPMVKRKESIVPTKPRKQPLPIPKGARALSISQREVTSIPDLLDIGSYLDVMGYASNPEGRYELRTVARVVQVISVSPLDAEIPDKVTLALKPKDAEKVLKAMAQGKLQLALRADNAEDDIFDLGSDTIEVIRGVDRETH